MELTYTVEQLAQLVGGVLRGDGAAVVRGVGEVSKAKSDQVAWVSRDGYAAALPASRAGVVLVPTGFGPTPMPAILCDNIERSVARLLAAFAPMTPRPDPGVHPTAVVHPSARIAADAAIGPYVVVDADARVGSRCALHAGVFIGRGTTLGDDCEILPHVVILHGCSLGHRVVIHPNAVIGGDGFGYFFDEGRHHKIPHIGGVVIEDDVEIGACSCIDRSKFGNTVVGRGTKIDNLVQVAHNVRIGHHCVLVATSGIAGSSSVGDYVVLGGGAAILDNVAVGEGARLAAWSLADKDVPAGVTVSGEPARDHRQELRERALVRRLPKMVERMKDLLRRVEQLEASTHHRP